MIFIYNSTLIEGMIMPLTGSLLTFILYDSGYSTSSILLLDSLQKVPYLFFAFFPLIFSSRKSMLIAQIISSICLLSISIGLGLFVSIFVLSFMQILMHMLLIAIRKKYSKYMKEQIQGYAMIYTRIGIALGSISIFLNEYLSYQMIYCIYALIIFLNTIYIHIYNTVPDITFSTIRISKIKLDILALIFSFFIKAPEDIYRTAFNIYLSKNLSKFNITCYKVFIVMSLSIFGAYLANILMKHFKYINILRYTLVINAILYLLHNTSYILYISFCEIICKSMIMTMFLAYQNDLSQEQSNYAPMILLLGKLGSMFASVIVYYNTWLVNNLYTYTAFISFILYLLASQIRKKYI